MKETILPYYDEKHGMVVWKRGDKILACRTEKGKEIYAIVNMIREYSLTPKNS